MSSKCVAGWGKKRDMLFVFIFIVELLEDLVGM